MKKFLPICLTILVVNIVGVFGQQPSPTKRSSTHFENRCGWFSNPTPANMWFYDREGEWTIGAQGGYQVPGDWPWPAFKSGQWMRTNGDYGYGCACFRMRLDKKTFDVLEIQSARAQPLTVCRRDASLKKWRNKLN